MTGVNCYTVHMTILSPMGLPIFVCFRFRYKFHLWEDLLRESLDLCHNFTGLLVVMSQNGDPAFFAIMRFPLKMRDSFFI